MEDLFAGVDLSTQGQKIVIIDLEKRSVIYSDSINYDVDLPKYNTLNGVLKDTGFGVSESNPKKYLVPSVTYTGFNQKSGIIKENLLDFYNFSKDLGLNIIGIMCIPPFKEDSTKFFSQMSELNEIVNLKELSMGMSSDYLNAIEYKATYLRIGSNIFGQRS